MHLLEGYRQRRRERLRRLYERHKNIHRLLRKHGEDILQSENFRSTRAHIQHGTMTVHNHCMDVARYSLLLNKKLGNYSGEGITFLRDVADRLPESDTRSKILSAVSVKKDSSMDFVISVLGNGSRLTAQDTVPFCLWCAAYYYTSTEEALWTAVSALGDRDTICAIVGGMVSFFADELPQQWLSRMEHPESSVFMNARIR